MIDMITNPEINMHLSGQLTSDSGGEAAQWKKVILSTNGPGKN